jgi:hypothetical protein
VTHMVQPAAGRAPGLGDAAVARAGPHNDHARAKRKGASPSSDSEIGPADNGVVQECPSEASPLTAEAGGWCALSGAARLRGMAEGVTKVTDLLDGQVVLDVQCLDRIYLNGYVPSLQGPGRW